MCKAGGEMLQCERSGGLLEMNTVVAGCGVASCCKKAATNTKQTHQQLPSPGHPPNLPSMPSEACISSASGCTLSTVGARPAACPPGLPAPA